MGHHYIPQAYLKGFTEPGSDRLIWMYDKVTNRFSRATVKKVAQQSQFYPEDVEIKLSRFIEGPAHRVLSILRRGEPIDSHDRFCLAVYIATMLKRVPRSIDRRIDAMPEVIERTFGRALEQIEEMGRTTDIDPSIIEKRLREVAEAKEQYEKELPSSLLDGIRTPWASEELIAVIYGMTWRFALTTGPSFYLTTDNPAFLFEGYGLNKPESELTFPISSDLTLVANGQKVGPSMALLEVQQQLVKELNRRVASAATRFVFYRERQEWVATVAMKQDPELNRIQWQDET